LAHVFLEKVRAIDPRLRPAQDGDQMPHFRIHIAGCLDGFGDGWTEQLPELLPHPMHCDSRRASWLSPPSKSPLKM